MEVLKTFDLRIFLIFSAIFLVLFAIAEIAYHFFKIDVGYTRKFVHIFTGIITLFFPIYIKDPLTLILLCTSFLIILYLSKKFNFLPSINAIRRLSRGSILFPIVVIICYLVQYINGSYTYFFIPILILALADPMAEFIGKKLKYKPYSIFGNSKTISGSLGFFVVALLTAIIGIYLKEDSHAFLIIFCGITIAILTTLGEAVSIKGYDNLVIPMCAILGLLLFGI